MKAKLIKKIEGWTGDASLYHLDPPLGEHEYVIVSATIAPYSGPETYIFPATKDGEVIDYGELEGSFRGSLNHKTALKNAGYSL